MWAYLLGHLPGFVAGVLVTVAVPYVFKIGAWVIAKAKELLAKA